MRHVPTAGEKWLWSIVRDRKLGGHKFRRQQVIEPYIVDFVCQESRIVVELDGAGHEKQVEYDLKRKRWLESLGYEVLRFGSEIGVQDGDEIPNIILERCETRKPR